MDIRRPRDGRVLEELGTYDPLVPETDARAVLNAERINYWLSVGATRRTRSACPIKKYGAGGTHVAVQQAALDRLAQSRRRPEPMQPVPKAEKPAKPGASRSRTSASGSRPWTRPAARPQQPKRIVDPVPCAFDILTLFPEVFQGYLGQSLLKRAIQAGRVDVRLHNIRDWTQNKHNTVDDRPFGGGPGMVMQVGPVVECVEAVRSQETDAGHLVMLTPQGRRLDQPMVEQLATHKRIMLLCGRYEGFDERIRLILKPEEVSIGDYVLNGGEVAAMVVIETVIRLVPGVLGDEDSSVNDSFSGSRRWLECAEYTRPRKYRGYEVPPVLLGGNHEEMAQLERRKQPRAHR